jgi:putative membrane protein
VSLIRPLLDHVGDRDPAATRALEAFFLKGAISADLKVSLLTFSREGKVRATVALPTVHPGPFAALGASDLPRKLSERLGSEAGLVLVPHTPSDHDLDLPSEDEVERVSRAARGLLEELPAAGPPRSSPLVSPYPGSLARAQLLGNMVLVVVSQAPAPTDDIAYSVADRVLRDLVHDGIPPVALIDAHNSYIEGQGDIAYGSPAAEKLAADTRAAVQAALAAAKDGPVEVGVAARGGYSTGEDGIGPQGIRALVVRAAGTTTGYVLIDGNNLVLGQRDPIVRELLGAVDAAEVLTTDNHVVHEVDGGINPVGERIPLPTLTHEAREVLDAAKGDLGPVEVRFGTREIPAVRVLGPGLTARLLTSLGDTLSMFANMFPATLLLLLTSSLVVAFALR